MKITISNRILFTLGFLILIASNAVVISRVAFNRTGPDTTVIELTERELSLPYFTHEENSGMSLTLNWRTLPKNKDDTYYSYYYHDSPAWMDEEKLKSLGFRIDKPEGTRRYKFPVPRQAFVVLEYGGEPYQEALLRAEKNFEKAQAALSENPDNEKRSQEFKTAETQLQNEQNRASRLFAVDAGLNAETLRKEYPDQSRFVIAQAAIEQTWNHENRKDLPEGRISSLLVENIHVPLEFKKNFDKILAEKRTSEAKSPRYKVRLAYGSRFEPWIKAVVPI